MRPTSPCGAPCECARCVHRSTPARRLAHVALVLVVGCMQSTPLPRAVSHSVVTVPDTPRAVERDATHRTVDRPPWIEAVRVAERLRVLDALPHPDGSGRQFPDAATTPLSQLRAAMTDYLLAAMSVDRCGRPGAAPEAVRDCLDEGLRHAGIDLHDDAGPWGAPSPLRVEAVPGEPNLVVVTSALRLECSEDARVIVYALGEGPRFVERDAKITSSYDGRAYAVSQVLVPRVGPTRVVVIDQNDWCTSTWRTRRVRVFEASPDGADGRVVWAHEHEMFGLGDDSDEVPRPADRIAVDVDRSGVTLSWHSERLGRTARSGFDRVWLLTEWVWLRLAPAPGAMRVVSRRVRRRAAPW